MDASRVGLTRVAHRALVETGVQDEGHADADTRDLGLETRSSAGGVEVLLENALVMGLRNFRGGVGFEDCALAVLDLTPPSHALA